jgi:hypothetical protein
MRRAPPAWLLAVALSGACSTDLVIGKNLETGTSGAASAGGDLGSGGNLGAGGATAGGSTGTGPGATCPEIGLPPAAALDHVVALVDGRNVRVDVPPLVDAADYRIYALPAAGDVAGDAVRNATYRCSGRSEVPTVGREDLGDDFPGIRTRVDSEVEGFRRTAEQSTLGWVHETAGEGRVPVYALGDPTWGGDEPSGDNVDCYEMRWPESRVKRYTTSESERTALLDAHYRDDGIAFWSVPEATDGAIAVHARDPQPGSGAAQLYLVAGDELDARVASGDAPSVAFWVLGEAAEGAQPLRRVHYDQACARSHDELVAGDARYRKALEQGPQPLPSLHWSGLEAATTLVVEALDAPCPFQGILAPRSRPAQTADDVDYPAFLTVDDLRAGDALGQVFVNGQGPTDSAPRAIARACVEVAPAAPAPADHHIEPDAAADFGPEVEITFQSWDIESDDTYVELLSVGSDAWAVGESLGELRFTWGDWAAGSGGLVRATPKVLGTIGPGTFVHATMSVDILSTDRRYPQMLLATRPWPIEQSMEDGVTIIVQTSGGVGSPLAASIQLCDQRGWQGGDPCPSWDLYRLEEGGETFLAPQPELNAVMGADRVVRFDVFASTDRVYLFADRLPYGCVDLPPGVVAPGPMSLTFGDVLFVSGSDADAPWYTFLQERMPNVTSHHFSEMSLSSGVDAPSWNEARHPCVSAPPSL